MPVIVDSSFTSATSWVPDMTCCAAWSTYSPTIQAYATAISAWGMWSLTGRRYGYESRSVRPCFAPPLPPLYQVYPVYLLNPWGSNDGSAWSPAYIWEGVWHNKGCAGVGCCGAACEVQLPGPVQSIDAVTIDGAVLDPSAYRVDNFTWLVRQDGDCWPACQDMDKQAGAANTWTVDYQWGLPVPAALLAAQGAWACEIAASCSGKTCRLPQRMQSLSRNGVTAQFVQPSAYIDRGLTNLPEVDMAIAQDNPNRLQQAPTIVSSDVRRYRSQTWVSP